MFSGENSIDGLRTPNTQLSQCKQCELSLKEDVIMSYAICLRKSRADAEAEARGEGEIAIGHAASLSFRAHYRRFFSPPRGSMRPSREIKKSGRCIFCNSRTVVMFSFLVYGSLYLV